MNDEIVIDYRDQTKPMVSLIFVAAAAGFAAAVVHAALVREHLAHWWGYGAFFAAVAVVQALAAVALLGRPERRILIAVAAGNVGLIGLYVFSRTVGTPFIGPHAALPNRWRQSI